MIKYDVIIVGAGIGGLCAGALLAHAGKKVLVLEKTNHMGGRDFSFTYKGHVIDYGSHQFPRWGYLEEVFSKVEKPLPELIYYVKGIEAFHQDKWRNISELAPSSELRKIFSEITASSYEQIAEYDDVSLKDWVSQRSDNEGIHLWFWYNGMLMCTGNRYETISAGEYFRMAKATLENSQGLKDTIGLVRGGYSKLTQPLLDVIQERGGEIRTGVAVRDITTQNGRVQGVKVDSGERVMPGHVPDLEGFEAPVVVSTVPLWDLFKTFSTDAFPEWYVEWIEGIQNKITTEWTLVVALDRPLWDESALRWVPELPRTGLGGLFVHYPTYGEAAGQTNMLIWAQPYYFDGVPNPLKADSAKIQRDIRKLFDDLEEDAEECIPELKSHRQWSLRHLSIYNISETPALCGKQRPGMFPPGIEGLYLVSDTIRFPKGAMGTQASAYYALHCVDHILGNE